MALGKGRRLLSKRPRLIPSLKTGFIEVVERANVVDPGEHPTLELWPTARRLEKIPSHMCPAIGQNERAMVLGQAFVGTVSVTDQHYVHHALARLGKMLFR